MKKKLLLVLKVVHQLLGYICLNFHVLILPEEMPRGDEVHMIVSSEA